MHIETLLMLISVLLMIAILLYLFNSLRKKTPILRFNVSHKGCTFEDITTMILTTEQKVRVEIDARTAAGNPATFDGDPIWESSNDEVAHVEVDPTDSRVAWVISGAVGTTQISVRCDADLDDNEVREIVGNLDVTVMNAEAQIVQIVAGEPELK